MISIKAGTDLSEAALREALALLFADRDEEERRVRTEQTLESLRLGELEAGTFLTAWNTRRLRGVLVVETLPGNSASLWPIAITPAPDEVLAEDALLSEAVALLKKRRLKFAQMFLPPHREATGAALERHGFHQMTEVRRLVIGLPAPTASLPADLVMEPLASAITSTFQHTLIETFAGSLDAPELDGLRTPEELLAGHRAGAPDLTRWWLAIWAGRPVGVLILAGGLGGEVQELSYCGVVPRERGRGVGQALVAFSLQKAADFGNSEMTLLVDARNRPALDLYLRAGFLEVETRSVFFQAFQLS